MELTLARVPLRFIDIARSSFYDDNDDDGRILVHSRHLPGPPEGIEVEETSFGYTCVHDKGRENA